MWKPSLWYYMFVRLRHFPGHLFSYPWNLCSSFILLEIVQNTHKRTDKIMELYNWHLVSNLSIISQLYFIKLDSLDVPNNTTSRNGFYSVLFITTCFGLSSGHHQVVDLQLNKMNCYVEVSILHIQCAQYLLINAWKHVGCQQFLNRTINKNLLCTKLHHKHSAT